MFLFGSKFNSLGAVVRLFLMSGIVALGGCGFLELDDAPSINQFAPSFTSDKPITLIEGDHQIDISWPAHKDATGYTLYWSTQANFTLATAEKLSLATSNYKHQGLSNGTTYYYAAGINSDLGLSLPSGVSAATPDLPQLSAPANFKVLPGSKRSTLYWDAVDGASSYSVYWSNNASVGLNDNRIDFTSSPFVHENLKNGFNYSYVVVANYREKPGVFTPTVQTIPNTIAPVAPATLTYTRDALGISLQWPVFLNETVNIYWSVNAGVTENSAVYVGQLPLFRFPTNDSNSDIYFRLQASNGVNGNLSFEYRVPAGDQASELVLNNTQPAPTTLVDLNIAVNDHQLSLDWSHNDPTMDILIYYKRWC